MYKKRNIQKSYIGEKQLFNNLKSHEKKRIKVLVYDIKINLIEYSSKKPTNILKKLTLNQVVSKNLA